MRWSRAALLAVLLGTGTAHATDDAGQARAAQLFDEAKKLRQEGKDAEACAKLEESVKLYEGVGNRFQLADCWETIGRTASAHAMFVAVEESTRALEQKDREKLAHDRAEALLPKLSRLRLEVPTPAEGLTIS